MIEALLSEKRTFDPPAAWARNANITDPAVYARAAKNPEEFWAAFARELEWASPWASVLDGKLPHPKWFSGGKLNASVNCVDRHLATRSRKAALIWEGEPGDVRTLTYADLYREVCRFANGLRSLGVAAGDRVAIYLPMIPELPVAMLACARIGAIHSVVFGGFSAESLAGRIEDAAAKVVITADGGWRRGRVVELKRIADQAMTMAPTVKNCIVVNRGDFKTDFEAGRDIWWNDLIKNQPADCPPEPMEAQTPLYILYTSGTTGKPKGIVHATGGYLVGAYATSKWVFDLKEDDIYWCTADIGWVTGHSYVVYGPLANGATCLMYEGAPDFPERDRFWNLVEKHRVTILYTAPTAIRAFMKWGTDWPRRHSLSSLRLLGSVGEPINPEAWIWYQENIGGGRCPVVDTWWQTETGMIMITPLPGLTRTKPGSATKPFPGVEIQVLDTTGTLVRQGGGYLAITKPWPAMTIGIWGDEERFLKTYFSRWGDDVYFPADGARFDADGDFWLLGRVDDVINVAGHRIGTMEVESALVDHPAVAEAAVVGVEDELKGMAIAAFVILKDKEKTGGAAQESGGLGKILQDHVVRKIGALARPGKIFFTADLPKTRSGKIMRRLLRDIAEGKALGDTTTLADPAVVQGLKERYESSES